MVEQLPVVFAFIPILYEAAYNRENKLDKLKEQ